VPLAKLYEESGRYDDAEALLVKARDAKPNDPTVYTNLAAFYNRQGDFPKTIESLQKAADLNPNNPEGYHLIATYYWDKARKDFRLSTNDQKDFIMKGLAMEDKALGLNPEYMEAMTYKNILLRMEANTEKDKKKQDDLLKQADELRNKALELQKKKASSGAK
jgi:tetratricopeptide (TPR) repeat protein